jgi:chromosome partitioning protein
MAGIRLWEIWIENQGTASMSHEMIQLIGAAISLVVLIGTIIWWSVRRYIRGLRSRIRKLEGAQEPFQKFWEKVAHAKKKLLRRSNWVKKQEKLFEETLVEKKKLRAERFRLESKLRTVRSELSTAQLTLEQQKKNFDIERETYLHTSKDQTNEIKSLRQQLVELRQMTGTQAPLAGLIQERDEELDRLNKEKLLLEERIKKSENSHEQICRELETKIEGLIDQSQEFTQQIQELSGQFDEKLKALEEANKKIAALEEQLDVVKKERQALSRSSLGRVWERPLRSEVPPFLPLAKRRGMVIISVVNLKGGVGKTTLAANLAAIVGNHGKRVLLVDLDYQRSLSKLCFPDSLIGKLHKEKRTLQHFLLHSQADGAHLLNCVCPNQKVDTCDIIINSEALEVNQVSDSLEDTEMHLQAEWLMNPKGLDVRFILRKALHDPAVSERYDYVFLDCPPRLSTACINGLAASDFALIPVMLDALSSVSAPNLLRKLNQLRTKKVLSDLRILGVIANRVKIVNSEPIKTQADEWNDLFDGCKQAWPQPVHLFRTMIRQSTSFEEAAKRKKFAAITAEFRPLFIDLLSEIEARIKNESVRLATVPA